MGGIRAEKRDKHGVFQKAHQTGLNKFLKRLFIFFSRIYFNLV